MQAQKKKNSKKNLYSVGTKILLLVSATALFSALFVGGFFFVQTSKNALRIQTDALASDARLISPLFLAAFSELANDVSVLSKMAPVQGIIKSKENGGIDAERGMSTKEWSQQLENIFASMLSAKSSYVQVRFIGVADNGRELVRVNRNGSDIKRVPPEELQQKGDEPYFKDAINLAPNTVYHSVVSANRENGVIQKPLLPVVRTITPVYDSNNKMYGFIVINVAYEEILKDVIKDMEIDKDLYIVNENGDFIHYDKKQKNSEFKFGDFYNSPQNYPIIQSMLNSKVREDTIYVNVEGEEQIVHFRKEYIYPSDHVRFFITAIAVPKKVLLKPVHVFQREALFLTIGLTAIASLCAAFFSSLLIKPLKHMIEEIKGFDKEDIKLNLPVSLNDEIGDLARAFDGLMKKLNQSRIAEIHSLGRLQAIVDNTVDGLITINEQGYIENFNKSCESIFGYSADEVIGKNVKMLMPEPYHTEHDSYLDNYNKTGDKKIIGIGREVKGKRKDGTTFPLDLSVSEVQVKGRRIYSGIVRDITDRKKAEEEIMRSNEELERFAYIASHDLQEPLRMVANFTNLLESDYGDQFDDQAAEYMSFITSAAQRMQDMVGDLLEYSRIGYESAGFTEVDSKSHTQLALNNLQEIIEETKAVITIEELPDIYVNAVRFSRLMQNLIGNAIKYRARDRTPEVRVKAVDKGNEWLFSVSDNGIGMKEEYLEQIFIIFKRLHSKQEYKGTGIGLAVCKKIVESFDGKIWAESNPGRGSTFYFTIPKREVAKLAA